MTRRHRPKGRTTGTHEGSTAPAGAVVPEPRIRPRVGGPDADDSTDAEGGRTRPGLTPTERARTQPPAEVVHLIPAEHLDAVDTTGMSMPVGVGDSAAAVRLPGDIVLTRPAESDIPSDDELDRRDTAKGRRRKRMGPTPPDAPPGGSPGTSSQDPHDPAESAPPPTDPS